MEFKIRTKDLLKHLTFWHNKTDDECIEMATNENGVDAERALTNMVERDFCTSISDSIVEELIKYSKLK
jgi:hypothetical protein